MCSYPRRIVRCVPYRRRADWRNPRTDEKGTERTPSKVVVRTTVYKNCWESLFTNTYSEPDYYCTSRKLKGTVGSLLRFDPTWQRGRSHRLLRRKDWRERVWRGWGVTEERGNNDSGNHGRGRTVRPGTVTPCTISREGSVFPLSGPGRPPDRQRSHSVADGRPESTHMSPSRSSNPHVGPDNLLLPRIIDFFRVSWQNMSD